MSNRCMLRFLMSLLGVGALGGCSSWHNFVVSRSDFPMASCIYWQESSTLYVGQSFQGVTATGQATIAQCLAEKQVIPLGHALQLFRAVHPEELPQTGGE